MTDQKADDAAPQQLVFIDSNVPDLQDLLDGLAPGTEAFVLDPDSDGLDQIAAILAANDLTGLTSISIVGHGAPGQLQLGSATLTDANLTGDSAALAQIGAALRPGGSLQVYGCDVASGADGLQFITDLSRFAGGATVAAASADIGLTPAGENWALDVSSASGSASATSPAVTVTSPFTASAEASFTGTLVAPPTTELWVTATQGANENMIFYADDTGNGTASNVTTVLDPTSQAALNLFNATNSLDNLQLMQLDTQNNTYVLLSDGETGTHRIFTGSLSALVNNPGATPVLTQIHSDTNSGTITGLAVDAENAPSTVFFDEGKSFYKVSYSGTTTTLGTAADFLDGVALDLPHHVAYFANSDSSLTTTTTLNGLPDRSDPNGNIHYIDTITSNSIYETSNLTASSSSVTISKLADIPVADGSLFDGVGEPGITVDTTTGLIYFTTHAIHTFNVNTASGIYVYNPTGATIAGHAPGLSILWTQGTGSGGPTGLLGPIVVDDATGKYYVTMDNTGSGLSGEGGSVYVGNLNANGTTAPTLFTTVATFSGGNVRPDPNGLALDNAPVLAATGTTSTFTESASNPASSNNTPVSTVTGLTATDSDNSELTGATISISTGLFAGDALSVTLTGAITIASNTGGVLTLTGTDTLAHYQTVLNSVKFTSTSDNPTNYGTDTSRTLTLTVNDGLLNSAPLTASVTVVGTDDAPVNTVPGSVTTNEDTATHISGLSVSDADANPASQNLTVTLSVLNGTLTLGSTSGLSFSVGANGSASMTFSGTANAINTALAAGGGVLYTPNANFNTGFGSEQLTISTDDNGNTGSGGPLTTSSNVSITVTAVNDPPALQPHTTSPVSYLENASPTALFAGESINSPIADPDQSANFAGGSLSVALTSGAVTGDEVVFVPGTLTLSGSNVQLAGTTIGTLSGNGTTTATVSLNANATPAAVNDLLVSFAYESTSDDPGAGDRTITETFNDGGNTGTGGAKSDSITQTEHVTPVNDPPTLSATGANPTYTENAPAVAVYTGASASTIEAGQAITTLALTVSNVSDSANEILHIDGSDVALTNGNSVTTAGNGLGASVTVSGGLATVTLVKAGGVTAATLDTILDNLTYRDAGDNPTGGVRTVTLTSIMDNGGTANGGQDTTSLSLASTVTVVPVNDAPVVTAGGSSTYTEQASAGVVDAGVTVSDVDSPNLVGATVTINPGTLQAGDTLLFTNTGTITGVYSAGTLTLTGTDTPANYQAALRSVTFENLTNDDPTAGGTDLSRTITWQVNDGSGANNLSNQPTSTVNITAVDDPPTITAPTSFNAQPHVAVTINGITFADVDSAGGSEKATFTASAGTFTAASGGGVTVLGSTTSTLSLTGTIANLNSFISGSNLQFTGAASDTVNISLDDQSHTGSPDAAPGTASIPVNVSGGTVNLFAAAGAGPTILGIAAPGTGNGPVTITLNSVPSYGTLAYLSGQTLVPVTAGATLTSAELTSLEYTPPASGEDGGQSITYTVSDNSGPVQSSILVSVFVEDTQPANLYFSAFGGSGNGGNADLYTLDTNGNPLAIPMNSPNGSDAGEDGGFVQYAGNLIFNAFNQADGEAVFSLAPGSTTPAVVRDTNGNIVDHPDQIASNFTEFAGSLYFTGEGTGTTGTGLDLFRLDANGIATPIDANPGFANAFDQNLDNGFVDFNNNLYFAAYTPTANDSSVFELAPGSTTPVNADPGNLTSFDGEDGGFVVFNNTLYFNAFGNGLGEDTLFQLTPGSTTPQPVDPTNTVLQHLDFGISSAFHVFNGSLYFNEFSDTLSGNTLFRLDANGTLTALTFNNGLTNEALGDAGSLGGFADFAGSTYFAATTAGEGTQLFKLDGSGNITQITATPGGAFDGNLPGNFIVFAGSLYFDAYAAGGGDSLFKLTAGGTLTTVNLGNGAGATTQAGVEGGFKILNGSLYFSAFTPAGDELVKLAANGTATVFDINPGPSNNAFGSTTTPNALGIFPNDVLNGTPGKDILLGGAENDTFNGGAGGDILTGGGGADTFVFSAAGPSNTDLVTDYSFAQGDILDVSQLFVVDFTASSHVGDFVRLVASGNDLMLQVDPDGPGNAQTWENVALLQNANTGPASTAGVLFAGTTHTITQQITVAIFEANQSALDQIPGGFAITDTAANIGSFAGLAALNSDIGHITTITATDTQVVIGYGRFGPYQAALDKIVGGFTFDGQASQIQTSIDAIAADASHINSITAENGTVTVPVATFLNDQAGLNEIVGDFAIADTAANIFNGLGLLEADASHITSVTATDVRVQVGAGKFTPDETILNKIAVGFDILGLSANIGASFDAFEADVSHIGSLMFADPSTPVLNLTQSQATNDSSLLAKIASSYVENVSNAGATTTTGHGNGLTITGVAGGNDTINGTGTSESFVFGANFGVDTVVDFSAHLASPGNDTITLPASEFTDFNTMFSNDTTFSGGNAIIQSGGDKLTIDNINSATLQANQANFHFA